jgi:transcriptional regulator with XRE-family HTH domain
MENDGRACFTEQLATLRSDAGLSLADVAGVAHVARGYVHHIEHGRRWPTQRVAEALDHALGADGGLLAAWEAAERAGRPDRADIAAAVSTSHQPEAVEVALAADESARLLAWAEASNIGDLTLEQMHSDVRWIAQNYLKAPTLPLFSRARAIRDQAFALLAGHQRPDQSRDLYVVAGWALTLLAWITTDLGRPDVANTHARAAWLCADNADHHGLRAWIRATQHTAAFWEHHFLDAARHAEDGLRYATAGSAEAFLASAQALDLAKAGQADNARVALIRARDATEAVDQACDDLAGPFTCSADRAGGFWSDVYLALGQPSDALAEADRAVAAFERAPTERRNPGSERMARIQQVRAHLTLSQFDGAAEALTPVLDTAAEHRVRPLLQRLAEVRMQAMTYEKQDEPALRGLREAITDFRRQAVVAELST